MAETYDQKQARLNREKYIMMPDMARPGFQLIMTKLNQASDKMLTEYDHVSPITDPAKMMRIQIFREVVNDIIPSMLEAMMNVDIVEPEPEWTFKMWLKDIRECVEEFIDHSWLNNIKRLFRPIPDREKES